MVRGCLGRCGIADVPPDAKAVKKSMLLVFFLFCPYPALTPKKVCGGAALEKKEDELLLDSLGGMHTFSFPTCDCLLPVSAPLATATIAGEFLHASIFVRVVG